MQLPHLDDNGNGKLRWWVRNIALAVIIALIPIGLTGLWSASDAWSRLSTLERQMATMAVLPERIAKLEGTVSDLRDDIRELTRTLRQPERR